jgi:hypothetical protein
MCKLHKSVIGSGAWRNSLSRTIGKVSVSYMEGACYCCRVIPFGEGWQLMTIDP